MSEERFIWLVPVPIGRVVDVDDHLTPTERAFVEHLVEFPADRLREIVNEVLAVRELRAELEELRLPYGDEGL